MKYQTTLFSLLIASVMCGSLASAAPKKDQGPFPPDLTQEEVLKRNETLPDYKALHALVADKKKNILWVITGDSITHGCMHTHGIRSYPEHWMEFVKWELRRTDDIVVNSGISGEITTGTLNKFDWRVGQFKPQVVSINLGMNDVVKMGPAKLQEYKKNLETLVEKVRKLKAIPILQITSPTINMTDARAQNLEQFWKAIYEVAQEKKVLLVDHGSHWKTFASEPAVRKSWMNDAIHPNGKGHAEMYKKMAYDLGFFDPNKPTSKLGDKTL